MKYKKIFIPGLILITLGISPSIFTPFTSRAEAAIIINTCTGTFQVAGYPAIQSGSDTAAGILGIHKPEAWISKVLINLNVSETSVSITLSADVSVDTYWLVKTHPDGSVETIALAGNTYLDTNITGDTVYYYAAFAFKSGLDTSALSDSVPVGITGNGVIISPVTSDSTAIEVRAAQDTRVSVRIQKPNTVFGAEVDMLILVIRLITLDELPVPAWAKKGIVNPYEVYCITLLEPKRRITRFSYPVELTFAYDVQDNKVKGTNISVSEILNRLSNFRWNGDAWNRIPTVIDLADKTLSSWSYDLSYFAICDIAIQQPPGFPYYGAGPNPFTPNNDGYNDVTYFRFPVAEEPGTLEIFDLRGAVVYREQVLQGVSWMEWDGHYNMEGGGKTDLADSGIYIWQIRIGSNIYNGIVILAK